MNDGITIREMSAEEFGPLFREHAATVFAQDHSYRLADVLSEVEQDRMRALEQHMGTPLTLYLGAFDREGAFIGWSWGQQHSRTDFYMVNSGVLPPFRRRGVFSALVANSVESVTAKGFQMIYSRHKATNNAAIIPKLKAGFVTAKMEMDNTYGVVVHLHYLTNSTRRKALDYRAGQLAPDAALAPQFKM